jgi:hypothetical protein
MGSPNKALTMVPGQAFIIITLQPPIDRASPIHHLREVLGSSWVELVSSKPEDKKNISNMLSIYMYSYV